MKIIQKLLFISLLLASSAVYAQIELNISGGQVRGIPIAVVPFGTPETGALAHKIHEVIENDLSATGKFEPIDSSKFVSFPTKNSEVYYKDWRRIGAEILAIGEVWKTGEDAYEVRFYLFDVARQKNLGGRRIRNLKEQDLRTAAHMISDAVYQIFLDKPGAFNSKIAYVEQENIDFRRNRYRLMVADWDGYGAQEVYASWNPLLSPSWSPDSSKLAFVSFREGGSIVQVLDLSAGKAQIIANFDGINTAPSWSPDGTKLAYSTSRGGNPDIYIYDFLTKNHQRVTTHYAIDTEPTWTPDGKSIVFTSSRAGKPQIYKLDIATGKSTRVTFNGKENANASYDYNGKNLVLVHEGGAINVLEMDSKRLISLTKVKFDESPSFSPNGDMVLYASEQNFEPVLMVVSSDGRVRKKLDLIRGDVREPTWSPLRQ